VPPAEDSNGAVSEAADATRRTHLANERTYLAWWRTGLTALAVSLAVGRIVPELISGTSWPYVSLGAGYAVLGIVFIVYAEQRRRTVSQAVRRGEWAELQSGFLGALAALGVVLAVATLVVVIAQP
jgi:putative membrane protein